MGYYQGDFYAGARGDPGFLSFLGGIAKKAIGLIPGVGPLASTAISAVGRPGMGAMIRAGAPKILRRAGGAIMRHPVLSAAGAAGVIGAAGVEAGRVSRGRMLTTGMRRHRRMNVTNVRALRRAIRRSQGFAHLAKRVLRFTSPR